MASPRRLGDSHHLVGASTGKESQPGEWSLSANPFGESLFGGGPCLS